MTKTVDYKALGAVVRSIRRNRNMTQEMLADRVGMSASFLGHVERGSRIPSLETLKALCMELDVSADVLLGIRGAAGTSVKEQMESMAGTLYRQMLDLIEKNEDDR